MSDYLDYFKSENPIEIFNSWIGKADEIEENSRAFTLSTIGLDGFPNARTLLLKEFVDGEYIFYSNYNSVKGIEIEKNNKGAITFYWHKSGRQVRIQGSLTKISQDKSRCYFQSRALESQAASACSNQSEEIDSRYDLEKKFQNTLSRAVKGENIYPESWGGYVLTPSIITFFIYGDHRLNDRFKFSKNKSGNWDCVRLQP